MSLLIVLLIVAAVGTCAWYFAYNRCEVNAVIRGFRAFEAQEADAAIRGLINQSETHYGNFTTELEAVNKCAPFCMP